MNQYVKLIQKYNIYKKYKEQILLLELRIFASSERFYVAKALQSSADFT